MSKNLFCCMAALATLVLDAGAAPRQAVRSDNFVERFGVVTHFGYYDTPYGTRHNECLALLRELGVRYVRDGVDPQKKSQDLYDSCGIKILMVTSHAGSSLWDTTLAATWMQGLRGYKPASVLAIEGTNEYNVSNRSAWPAELRDFTRRLHSVVRNDPVYKNTPIVGPTLSIGAYSDVGDISAYVDYGALHWYAAGIEPAHNEFNFFAWHLDASRTHMFSGKKMWLTETGYHNATATHWGVSEAVAAKYIPRSLMWFLYYKGVEKVFTYELLDEWVNTQRNDCEAHWGLVRNDLSRKPAFTALKSCITLLKDPDTAFTPGSLDYTIEGDANQVMQVLFQKKSGVFYLVLWQEVRSFTPATQSDIAVSSRPLTVRFAQPVKRARVYLPTDPSNLSVMPVARHENASQISLSVPDHLMIVEIEKDGVLPAEPIRPDPGAHFGLRIAFGGKRLGNIAIPLISGTAELKLINAQGTVVARTVIDHLENGRELVWNCSGISLPKGGMIVTVSHQRRIYSVRVVKL